MIELLTISVTTIVVLVSVVIVSLRAFRQMCRDRDRGQRHRVKRFMILFAQVTGLFESNFIIIQLFADPSDLEQLANLTLLAVALGVVVAAGTVMHAVGNRFLRTLVRRLAERAPEDVRRRLRVNERLGPPRE